MSVRKIKMMLVGKSLSAQALRFILPAAIIIFGLSTFYAYSAARDREVASRLLLLRDDAEAIRQDMQMRFDELEHAQEAAARLIELELSQQAETDFDLYFRPHNDGTLRSSSSIWEGVFTERGFAEGFGAYVSTTEPDAPRRIKLLAAFNALVDIVQGLPASVDNIYFFTPNNDLVIYAPKRADKLKFYRESAPPGLDFQDEEFTQIIQPAVNPDGVMRCTSLQPIISDQSGKTWTSGCMTPVRIGGEQIGGLGSSIPLENLIGDEDEISSAGVRDILVTGDGMLVRHPDFIRQSNSDTARFLDLRKTKDTGLLALKEYLENWTPGEGPKYLEAADQYVFAERLEGPEWFVITALPGGEVRDYAFAAALSVLVAGFLATGLFLLVTVVFVRKNLANPLRALTRRANTIFGDGETEPNSEPVMLDELATLNKAFVEMQARVAHEHTRMVQSYDAVLDTLDDFAIFIVSVGGKITRASRGAHNIFRERISAGSSILPYLGLQTGEKFEDVVSKALDLGEAGKIQLLKRADDSEFWAELVLKPLYSERYTIGFALIVRDCTSQKTNELELVNARDAAEFEAETRKSLLATVSHEIRTPMTGILGMLEHVKEENSARSRDRALTVIEGAVDALMRVLDDVLENARAESGKLAIEEKDFESSELIRRISELFAPLAKRRGLILEIEPGPREMLRGDPARIQQIVANFLSNAIKFSSEGRVQLACEAREYSADHVTLAISVEDEGIGIEADKIDALFQPFEQASETTKREFGGTGLGLSISKELAQAMSGDIEVESHPGKGSKFSLVLRLARANQASDTLPGKAKSALVVGGTAMSRLTTEAALEDLGFRTNSVGSPDDLNADSSYDLIIADQAVRDADSHLPPSGRNLWVVESGDQGLLEDEMDRPVSSEKLRLWLAENPL